MIINKFKKEDRSPDQQNEQRMKKEPTIEEESVEEVIIKES